MRKIELYLLRHAQSMGNLTGDYSTERHDRLTSLGQKQANQLKKRLSSYKFEHVFVSPSLRAMQTIQPYLKKNKIKGEIWGTITEACWQEKALLNNQDIKFRKGNPIVLNEDERKYFILSNIEAQKYYIPDDETYLEGLSRVYYTKKILLDLFKNSQSQILIDGQLKKEIL